MPDMSSISTPETIAVLPVTPATVPATWVPWLPTSAIGSASKPFWLSLLLKTLATMTLGLTFLHVPFAVASAASHFGKPAGYEKPAGSKNGCR